MKVLAIERPVAGVDEGRFTPERLAAEARRVWELQQEGSLREIYFRADQLMAVLILECSGVEEARRILGSLELVRTGLIDFEVIPLAAYPGFARLFRPEATGAGGD